jgi:hypothetical protein
MPSSLAPREIRHRCSHLGWHHSRTRPGVDPRAHESRDPLHQPLPPRRHERLRDVVVAHMPPRSAVAPPQPLPRHRRAHLKGSPQRAPQGERDKPQGEAVALEPHGIRRRGRCHIAVVRTSWGRRRVRALEIRCRSRSHLAAVRASRIRRRERVPPDPPSRACSQDPPSRAPHGATVACVPSGSDAAAAPPCRRARLRDPPPRACLPDPSSRACSQNPPSRAPHRAAASCVPSGSNDAAAPTSPPCSPQGSAPRACPQIRRRARLLEVRA